MIAIPHDIYARIGSVYCVAAGGSEHNEREHHIQTTRRLSSQVRETSARSERNTVSHRNLVRHNLWTSLDIGAKASKKGTSHGNAAIRVSPW